MIRVLMADDHPLMRAGLKHILDECDDIELVAEVDNGHDVITRVREGGIDVVVLDMFMPGRNGIDLIKQVKAEAPQLPILVLSAHKEDLYAVRTIKAGASGYLCKDYAASELLTAIRRVAVRKCYIAPAVAELMARDFHDAAQADLPHTRLTDREYQIFLLLVAGKGGSEIASQLNLSAKTVSTHKTRIKEKMGLDSTSDLVCYAMRHGLMADDGGRPG